MRKPFASIAVTVALLTAAPAGIAPANAADAGLEGVLVTQVEGLVVVATDGSVADLKLVTPVSAELAPALEQRLRALRFKPVTVGGVAVQGKAAFVAGLAAAKQPEGGLRVSFDGIQFGPLAGEVIVHADGEHAGMTSRAMAPPRMPDDLVRAGVPGGGADIAVRFSPDGKVEEAAIVRSYVSGRRGGPVMRKIMREFDAAALDAARKWQANMPADAAQLSAKDRTTTTVITYSTGSSPMPYMQKGQWVPVQRTQKRPVPWLAGESDEADRIATVGGGASSGAFTLVAPLAGTPVM